MAKQFRIADAGKGNRRPRLAADKPLVPYTNSERSAFYEERFMC